MDRLVQTAIEIAGTVALSSHVPGMEQARFDESDVVPFVTAKINLREAERKAVQQTSDKSALPFVTQGGIAGVAEPNKDLEGNHR